MWSKHNNHRQIVERTITTHLYCRNNSKHRIECLSRSQCGFKSGGKVCFTSLSRIKGSLWSGLRFVLVRMKQWQHSSCFSGGLLNQSRQLGVILGLWNVTPVSLECWITCGWIPWEINLINLCLVCLKVVTMVKLSSGEGSPRKQFNLGVAQSLTLEICQQSTLLMPRPSTQSL